MTRSPGAGPRPGSDTWVVAVHRTEHDRAPIGSGFLIDGRRVLTCAHVAWPEWSRSGELWIAFPKAEELMHRRVRVREVLAPPEQDHELQDAAALLLDLDADLPGHLAAPLRQPAPEDLVGTAWWAFGFPNGSIGNSASGLVGEALAYLWARLDTGGSGSPVKAGYSGAAVWSHDYQAVVGMVGQAQGSTGDALALSLRAVAAALPEQRLQLLTDWSLRTADETARTAWGWALGTDPEARQHWHPRARGVSTGAERGHRFSGRTAVLRAIAAWLTDTNPPRQAQVLTGRPGSGKSAVLGRVVTTADPEAAAELPATDTAVRMPPGSVSCAVHAKGKTAVEVAHEIARAASAALPARPDDLATALREALESLEPPADGARRPFTLVIDALDEAVTPAEARTIVRGIVLPLVETCAGDLGVRVIVGTRRRDDAGDLLTVFGPAAHVLDLDDPEFFAQADLEAYAMATLRLTGDERSDNPYAEAAVAAPVARRIAALAAGNFLVAGLVARGHGLHDKEAVRPGLISFPATLDAALSGYLGRLPDVGTLSATEVLTALALAEGSGLSLGLWRTAIAALYSQAPDPAELLRFVRSSAANFVLVSGVSSDDEEVFRPFHYALNESLGRARAETASRADDEAALARAFMAQRRRCGWENAPSYLLGSLGFHAVRGGIIDELLTDERYLLHADLRRLVPLAMRAQTPRGRELARLLRKTPRAIGASAAERVAQFSVTEAQEELGSAFRESAVRAPYRAVWAAVDRVPAQLAILEGHNGHVADLCAAGVGGRQLIVSAGNDRTVRTWDAATGEPVHVFDHEGWIQSVCAVPVDGTVAIASAGRDGLIRLWDLDTGALLRTLQGHDQLVSALCSFQIDGRSLIASAGRDRRLRVWDPATGELLQTFRGRVHAVKALCPIRFDGRTHLALLSGGIDRWFVRLWDPVLGKTSRTIRTRGGWFRQICRVELAGRDLLALSSGATDEDGVELIDPTSGRAIDWFDGGVGSVHSLRSFTFRGHRVLAAGYGEDECGSAIIWDIATGSAIGTLEGHGGWVWALCNVEADGRELIVTGGQDGMVRLWDLDSQSDTADGADPIGRVGDLCTVDAVGRTLVAGIADSAVVLWDPTTGHRVRTHAFPGYIRDICALKCGDRSYVVASCRNGETDAIHVIAPGEESPVSIVAEDLHWVQAMCTVDVDGRLLLALGVSGSSKPAKVQLWDPLESTLVREIDIAASSIHRLGTITVAGRALLAVNCEADSYDDTRVCLWDPSTGDSVRTMKVTGTSYSTMHALDIDGTTLLATVSHVHDDSDDELRIGWLSLSDPLTGEVVRSREVHRGWVNSVRVVEVDGAHLLATVGQDDRTIRLWEPNSLHQVLEIPVRQAPQDLVQVGDTLVIGLETGVMAIALPPDADT
ncbi:hypothetical protein OG500_12165 [Kitasatospora sp. NBC_01250]|uniref:WD40 repeat domain-containing protein n=1 Tax=Kitasatospora sp. NBC_01250 TaxID=2903571 RepID=UPI002E37C1E4|nr:WD40 repeat domain-containing protein [Kitasatospora sp. NBC_01250]